MKLHVLTNKSELKSQSLHNQVVVVLDILIATSSIVTVLANGCNQVVPVKDYAEALNLKSQPEFASFKFSGEHNTNTLQDFIQPTPIELLKDGMDGHSLVFCTTNGTVALQNSQSAKAVYVGSLLNAQAIVNHILLKHSNDEVLVVCSGSNDEFNIEDFYGAGFFVQSFIEGSSADTLDLSDCALAAKIFHSSASAIDLLSQSRVGKLLIERKWDQELAFCAQKNIYTIIPQLNPDGRIRLGVS
jgi:2-phosphosulfolactate phosphatase